MNLKMRKFTLSIFAILLTAFCAAGCAKTPLNADEFMSFGMYDLEKARESGKVRTFSLSYDVAFDEVKKILGSNTLTIYSSSRKKRYIVAMGFPKQINTTRVGIFFDPVSGNQTKITLSSLSSTALEKADTIIFGGLKK